MWFVRTENGCCSNKQTAPKRPIFSIVALYLVPLLQFIIGCLVTLASTLFLYPYHDTHTHTQVCHPWRCEWSLYGRCWAAQGGIWSFSPLSRWNVNTPVAWICQMSTWYFKVASWLWLFFFKLGWEARLFCIMYTYTQAGLHAQSVAVVHHKRIVGVETQGETGQQAHTCTCTHIDTTTLTPQNAFFGTCTLHTAHSHVHTHIHNTLRHSLTWPCV